MSELENPTENQGCTQEEYDVVVDEWISVRQFAD
jgi:hypothetical protein